MVNLLRRRETMLAQGGGPIDVTWVSSTDSYPDANGLFTKSTNVASGGGVADVSIDGSYTKIRTRVSGSWLRYTYPDTYSKGVMEVVSKLGSSTNVYSIFALGNGTNAIGVRVQHSTNYKGIYLMDGSGLANCTKLMAADLSTEYKIKLVLDSGYADVYVNDVLKSSNIDITTQVAAGSITRMEGRAAGSSYVYVYLKSCTLNLGYIP